MMATPIMNSLGIMGSERPINHVLKHKELAELEQRLEALENRLPERP